MFKNNFDFLRLVFSIFVLINHSCVLMPNVILDPLQSITNSQNALSTVALSGFFLTSGFLVFPSLVRSKTKINYLYKRILRIFPGIAFITIITCIVCVFFYEGSAYYYFTHWSVYRYFIKAFTLFFSNVTIYNIFDNHYVKSLNGSMWTIPYEFICYLLILLLFSIRKNNKLLNRILLVSSLFLILDNCLFYTDTAKYYFLISGEYLLFFGSFFVTGAYLSTVPDFLGKHKNSLLIIGLTLMIVSTALNFYFYVQYLVIPLIIIPLGLYKTTYIYDIKERIGDLSYGIYISGFFIQQIIIELTTPTPYELMAMSIPLSIAFGYISWHFVEEKSLKLKKYL